MQNNVKAAAPKKVLKRKSTEQVADIPTNKATANVAVGLAKVPAKDASNVSVLKEKIVKIRKKVQVPWAACETQTFWAK